MNKKYVTPESEVLYFETEDVIMTSSTIISKATKSVEDNVSSMLLDAPDNW